jgi:glycosyltransferase involved in cell wall biosynthesis
VIIEAAAAGIPAVGSRIYGLTDAIVDGETGFLHEPRHVADIVAKLTPIVADGALRRRLGAKAQERAGREFSQKAVTDALLGFYRRVLGA